MKRAAQVDEMVLIVEEYEALRLKDLMQMYQRGSFRYSVFASGAVYPEMIQF